jgi:hypothetical protein
MLTRQQRRALARRQKERPPQRPSKLRRAAQLVVRAATFSLSRLKRLPWWADVLGVLAAAYLGYQILYELVPEIVPDAAISPSWNDLPLKAKNRSLFFDMGDVRVFCVLQNITFKGPEAALRLRSPGVEKPLADVATTIPATETITFPCDMSKDFKSGFIKDYRGGPIDTTDSMPVALIKLKIRIAYSINCLLFRWRRNATSQSFTWRAVSGGYQWLEGYASDKIN